eukprot:TRINITY_DN65612_c0_g1_i1.p1 TRINITY_DN65612_c0_g1~~TRINITY_DN65612_c0_g1_i1.p1  ORF type:complete len:450 (+),score=103.86 TRINITY_DN65612_c0_g1_i1:83-1432(+)
MVLASRALLLPAKKARRRGLVAVAGIFAAAASVVTVGKRNNSILVLCVSADRPTAFSTNPFTSLKKRVVSSQIEPGKVQTRAMAYTASGEWDGKTVLVLGGGVIGVSISYHLALRGVSVKLIDRAGIASCASGKAGGFLAKDWNDGSPVGALTRKSFDMHDEVAKRLNLKSYRRLTCKSVAVDGSGSKPSGAKLKNLEWTDLGVRGSQEMGDESTIAQVHPKELVDAMWSFAESKGSTFTKGVVESLTYAEDGSKGVRKISGAVVDGQSVPADVVVLSMGPWGNVLQEAMPDCQMLGVKYHSVLMRSGRVLNEAVFFSGLGDPEVYPRNDGNTYVTGFPDPPRPVMEVPGEVEVREDICKRLTETMKKVSSEMDGAEVTLKQSCYLPFTTDSVPCMGAAPGHSNAYVATGHGCWGILNSLASGLAMSELILDGKSDSIDMRPFDPARFS